MKHQTETEAQLEILEKKEYYSPSLQILGKINLLTAGGSGPANEVCDIDENSGNEICDSGRKP